MHPATSEDLRFRNDGDHLVVEFPQEIDLANAPLIRSRLLRLLEERPAGLVLDMSGTHFCDSSGIEVIFRAHVRASRAGLRLHLVLPPPGPARTACAITGVTRVVPNFPTLAEARAAFASND
ncbi:STAS domain-containing protein [Actinomadura hibisca]|uniref:STAS domain-containing protein n=1 Tax=Actinomadura hibisca TaxID=68565 RepID=UPI000834F2E3|nr:STAS domain-containing protein [Actinomadura hibisca]